MSFKNFYFWVKWLLVRNYTEIVPISSQTIFLAYCGLQTTNASCIQSTQYFDLNLNRILMDRSKVYTCISAIKCLNRMKLSHVMATQ